MMLIDTSVLIQLFRDDSGLAQANWRRLVRGKQFYLSRLTQIEVLHGSLDEDEWQQLQLYLDTQDYLELTGAAWEEAARIYFDLRRLGVTVSGFVDCCIAQLAIQHRLILVHNDRDYEAMGRARKFRRKQIDLMNA